MNLKPAENIYLWIIFSITFFLSYVIELHLISKLIYILGGLN